MLTRGQVVTELLGRGEEVDRQTLPCRGGVGGRTVVEWAINVHRVCSPLHICLVIV